MPLKNETRTQTRRTTVGSTSMYSAIPPHTPAIFYRRTSASGASEWAPRKAQRAEALRSNSKNSNARRVPSYNGCKSFLASCATHIGHVRADFYVVIRFYRAKSFVIKTGSWGESRQNAGHSGVAGASAAADCAPRGSRYCKSGQPQGPSATVRTSRGSEGEKIPRGMIGVNHL
jgi:hypothetical protein